MRTGESKILNLIAAAMLNRDDVLDLICDEGLVRLPREAILTSMFGAFADAPTNGSPNHGFAANLRTDRAFA